MTNQEIEEKLISLMKPRINSGFVISHGGQLKELIPDSLTRVELDADIEEAFGMKTCDDLFYFSRSTVGELITYIQLSKNDPLKFETLRQAFFKSVEEQRKRKTIWAGIIFILFIFILTFFLWRVV